MASFLGQTSFPPCSTRLRFSEVPKPGTTQDHVLVDLDFPPLNDPEMFSVGQTRGLTRSNTFPTITMTFDGQGPVDEFLQHCQERGDLYRIDESEMVQLAAMNLRGEARKWWRLLGKDQLDFSGLHPWYDFCDMVNSMYPKFRSRTEIARQLFSREYAQGSVTDFILESLELYRLWTREYLENEILEILKDQLGRTYGLILRCRVINSVKELIELVKNVEFEQSGAVQQGSPGRQVFTPVSRRSNFPRQSEATRPRTTEILCFKCGQAGHFARNCKDETTVEKTVATLERVTKLKFLEPTVCFGRHYVEAKIDTGSDISAVSPTFVNKIRKDIEIEFLGTKRKLVTANSDAIWTEGAIRATLEWQGRMIEHVFDIIPSLCSAVLLGNDILSRLEAKIDFSKPGIQLAPLRPRGKVDVEAMNRLVEGAEVSSEKKVALLNLFQSYSDLFRDKPGQTDLVEHRMNTGRAAPVFTPPYRTTLEKGKIIDELVEEMVQNRVIEPANSPWSSPIHLVKKKSGDWRFCIDYRRVNAVSVRERFPLPLISEIMRGIGDSQYVSTLDLASGYWQVRVAPEDREKTAFITPSGMYQFRVMPFGTCGAVATFMSLMNSVLRRLIGKCALVYLDDIVIYSKNWDDHVRDLGEVCKELCKAGLTLSPDKCQIMRSEFDFLGLRRTPEGWCVQTAKVDAIREFPVPKCKKQVQSFLGMCGWYAQFIGNYAEIARPLYAIVGKKFQWSPVCTEAFKALKEKLTTTPVLAHRIQGAQLKLYVDASSYGLGCVLHQVSAEGKEQVLGYASRVLRKAEINYSATVRECLGVVWALSKFKYFFDGTEILVVTDHQALTSILDKKELTGKLHRWAVLLQEYPLRIMHRQGARMQVPDALSRNPRPSLERNIDEPEDRLDEVLTLTANQDQKQVTPWKSVTVIDKAELREEQRNDSEWGPLVEFLEAGTVRQLDSRERLEGLAKNYALVAGLLCRKSENPVPVIPESLRHKVLRELHDHPTAGHPGQRRTFLRCKSRVFWPGMRTDINNYVRSCLVCQKTKHENCPPAGLMKSTEALAPGDLLGVDIIGPLPRSGRGNNYILVIVDYFSRWAEAYPLKKATSLTIAKKLVFDFGSRFGYPRAILSDNGSQFVSDLMSNVYTVLKIKRKLTTPYHPQTNLTERINKSIKQILMTYVGSKHSTWDIGLPFAMMAIRSAVNETTGHTPAKLFIGRDLVLPFDQEINNLWERAQAPEDLLNVAREHTRKEQERQRKFYNRNRRHVQFKLGDWVLLRSHFLSSAESGLTAKFMPRWLGPFQVKEVYSDLNYELWDPVSGTSKGKQHVVNLKPFVERVIQDSVVVGDPGNSVVELDNDENATTHVNRNRRSIGDRLRRVNRVDYKKASGTRKYTVKRK